MAHFALQNKTMKDNMKRSIITDHVNVFFCCFFFPFLFERIIITIIIIMLCRRRGTSQEPFRRLQMRHLVDTRSLHFGNKTVEGYQKLHYNTNQEKIKIKKKAKGSHVYPNTDDFTVTLRPGSATCLSKHYKDCSAGCGRSRRWNETWKNYTFGYMFETATITAMHGLMSYRFPTAVREILKGLLR